MATTSLWRIKGRLGNVISYIENPEKTGGYAVFYIVFAAFALISSCS